MYIVSILLGKIEKNFRYIFRSIYVMCKYIFYSVYAYGTLNYT
jgi:hypothetical protein